MKKIISTITVLCLMVGLLALVPVQASAEGDDAWDGQPATSFASGSGIAGDAWKITTEAEWEYFARRVYNGETFSDKYIELAADLTFNTGDSSAWAETAPANSVTPAGQDGDKKAFSGNFDGKGHVISGVYMKVNSHWGGGLFGTTENATVKNFVLTNSSFVFEAKGWSAAVVGENYGNLTVENVYVTDSVYVTSVGCGAIGGIVGGLEADSNVTVSNCVFAGTVNAETGNSGGETGGIIGSGNSKDFAVTNCLFTGTVNGKTNVSGIAGGSGSATSTITNCISIGSASIAIAAKYKDTAKENTYISNCYYIGERATLTNESEKPKTENVVLLDSVLDIVGEEATISLDGWTKRGGDSMLPTALVTALGDNVPSTTDRWNKTYVVIWKNGETVLETDECKYGEMPKYDGAAPTKAEDNVFTYEFKGWTPEVSIVNVNVTYEAEFTPLLKNTDGVYNLWDGTTATAFAGGTGTEADPYQIANGAQLALMRDKVNDGTANTAYFKLTDSISLNASIEYPSNVWTPIGVGNAFKGSFDGNGKTISGLYVKYNGADGTGFFAMVNDATIKNFAIVASHIESTGTTNECPETGGLVAFIKNTTTETLIDSVYVHATVKGYSDNVGGIVGHLSGSSADNTMTKVTNCVFAGSVTGVKHVGGIVGNGNGAKITIENCLNAGNLEATNQYVAGIMGRNDGDAVWTIKNCISIGTLKATNTARQIVVGSSTESKQTNTVLNCYYVGAKWDGVEVAVAYRGAPKDEPTVQEKELAFFMGDTEITWANWTERDGDVIIPTGVASFAPALYAAKYTVTWVNEDGTVLATEEYEGGAMPEYKGATPTKASDDTYDYTFSNWSPALAAVTADTTYKAEFYKTRKSVVVEDEEETTETEAPETKAPESEEVVEDEGGCGSVIGGGAFALVAVIGSAVVFGKKKED